VSGRCGILGMGRGRSAGLDRATERRRIEESFDVFSVPADIQALIVEALDSPAWDWFRDCDGCTAVSEVYWPTIYFPPCLRHDFDWRTGRGGWEANRRFYRIQRASALRPCPFGASRLRRERAPVQGGGGGAQEGVTRPS